MPELGRSTYELTKRGEVLDEAGDSVTLLRAEHAEGLRTFAPVRQPVGIMHRRPHRIEEDVGERRHRIAETRDPLLGGLPGGESHGRQIGREPSADDPPVR